MSVWDKDGTAIRDQLPDPPGHGIQLSFIQWMDAARAGGGGLTGVVVEPDESLEAALKRFEKQGEKVGLPSEITKRQHDETPSARRKGKALAARTKAKRRERNSD